jgi:beta-phosphoglucomutase
MIKGFLFDLDGVIVDTAKYHFLAWKRLADELSIPFSENDNERLKGVSRMRSLDIILELGSLNLSEPVKEELASKKNAWYVDYITNMTPDEILPGAMEFIQQAKEQNIKIALGSASKNAMTILERLKITNYFDAIISGNEVSKAKPDPEVFLKGAEALGLAPEECVVFEDAAAGVEAANNGHMKCIGIGSKDVLGAADVVVEGLAAISVTTALNV